MSDYKYLYNKYKTKYTNLKNNLHGGNPNNQSIPSTTKSILSIVNNFYFNKNNNIKRNFLTQYELLQNENLLLQQIDKNNATKIANDILNIIKKTDDYRNLFDTNETDNDKMMIEQLRQIILLE